MNPALLFLVRRSFANAVRSRLARLRQPKYLISAIVGVGYFALVFGPVAFLREGGPARRNPLDRAWPLLAEWGGVAMVLLMAGLPWVLPQKGPPLGFLESEVAMLFPAPLTRQELIRYRLLDMQKFLVLPFLVLGLLFSLRQGAATGLRLIVGAPLVLNLLTLHQFGARLRRASLAEHGASGLRRQASMLAVVGTAACVVWFTVPPFPGTGDGRRFGDLMVQWYGEIGSSPAGWVLYPFRLPGRLMASADAAEFLLRALPLAALSFPLYWWVVRSDTAFEEAAADYAQVIARRLDAARKGRISASAEEKKSAGKSPFRLSPVGPPEPAFVWKSATESLRHVPLRLVILVVTAAFIALPLGLDRGKEEGGGGFGQVLAVGMAVVAAMLVFAGPSMLGGCLRADLELVETLKSLPIPGRRLVRSYLAGTVLPVAALQAVLVLGAALALPADSKGILTPAWRMAGALSFVLILPGLTAISAAVDAAGVLYFPAWIRPGQAQAQGGVEAMGYNILTMLGKVLLLGLGGGIPVALGASVVAGAALLRIPALLPASVLLGGVLAAGLILLEVNLLCGPLGRRFEDLDPAAEGMLQ